MSRHPIIIALLVLTVILGLLPYLPYTNARLFHGLPSEQGWDSRIGGNHGPWWGVYPQMVLVAGPMLLLLCLPLPTLLVCAVLSMRPKNGSYLLQGILLSALQWSAAFLHLLTVFWLVD